MILERSSRETSEYTTMPLHTSVGQDTYNRLQIDNSVNNSYGPWLYKIKGELHHITGTLLPPPGQPPMYSQLYIHDPDTALNHCMANRNNFTLNRETMQTLQDMLYWHHPLVLLYKQAYTVANKTVRMFSTCGKMHLYYMK
jgi:hypothetical protein